MCHFGGIPGPQAHCSRFWKAPTPRASPAQGSPCQSPGACRGRQGRSCAAEPRAEVCSDDRKLPCSPPPPQVGSKVTAVGPLSDSDAPRETVQGWLGHDALEGMERGPCRTDTNPMIPRPEFLSPNVSSFQQKLTRHTKRQEKATKRDGTKI